MSSATIRFLASLLHLILSSRNMLPLPLLRRSKSGATGEAGPCDCSHSTLASLSINDDNVSSADTLSSESCCISPTAGCHPPRVEAGHTPRAGSTCPLPFELLCDCLADFYFDELLPLRLVSKTWFAAVNAQDEYSRYIDHLPDEMPSDEYNESWAKLRCAEEERCPYSVDLLRARLTCSSRPISLRVVTSTLSEAETAAIGSLISEHLHRIEFLFVDLAASSVPILFDAMQRPAPMLRDLTVEVRGGGSGIYGRGNWEQASIPSDIFSGHAPLLESASLTNAVFSTPAEGNCPAFSAVTSLHLSIASKNCAGLPLTLAQCPKLESLDIEVDGWPSEPFLPPGMTPRDSIRSIRILAQGMEAAELDLLDAMTSPRTHRVSMPLPSEKAAHRLLGHLHGCGPLTFKIDNDQSSDSGWTHIELVCQSTKRVRGIDVNPGWSGACVMADLAVCALVDDIELVRLSLSPVGYCPLKLFATMDGTWTAVRTIRIDISEELLVKEGICGAEFPELVQVVLFHPALAPDAGVMEVADICTTFLLDLFAHSKTDTVTVVLTRDEETADLVTANPGAATNNPQCIVYRQSNPGIVPEL